MMFYRRRASPKHRYSIIEVDYGGGGHRTRLKDQINCCVYGVPPAPVYKGARGGGAAGQEGRARRSPTPTGSRTPSLFLVGLGVEGERGGRERKERGVPPPSPCPIRTRGEGHAALPWPPLLSSTKAHYGPLSPRGVPVTPRYTGKIPISPGTLPICKYRLPIYQSSCLDHFETPHHVRDHIWDSEQPSVHQNM